MKRYYVKDDAGSIEMEIFIKECRFSVHFPRYEQQRKILHANSCFTEMNSQQLGMLLFAYSEEEYHKFCEFYETHVRCSHE